MYSFVFPTSDPRLENDFHNFISMSNMENDARRFLNKIVTTIGLGLLWLFINMTMGLYNRWFFFLDKPTVGNYIFYGWVILSLMGLLIIYRRIWKEKFPHG
jgi:hypothetical protein